jgi:hypothetical protein
MKDIQDPVTGDDGIERHPAFGLARVGRIQATPGAVLFQSDARHHSYIEVTVSDADRRRDLKHDWVHPGRVLCKFSMSLAQFASFVSSAGTEGVPVTLEYADGASLPELPYEPRLSVSMAETHDAANAAFEGIKKRLAEYEALLAGKPTAAERRKALSDLRAAVNNATGNVDYAAKSLAEHAESVVEQSRADIEALALGLADKLGLPASELTGHELPGPGSPDSLT